jgi:hypothetical protein
MSSFSIFSDTGETSLDSGQRRTVLIKFNPTTAGVKGAALSVVTDVDPHKTGIGLRGAGIDSNINLDVELSRSGTTAQVRFASQVGATYELRRSDDLENWTTLQGGILGTGGVVPVFDRTAPQASAFYQVVRLP